MSKPVQVFEGGGLSEELLRTVDGAGGDYTRMFKAIELFYQKDFFMELKSPDSQTRKECYEIREQIRWCEKHKISIRPTATFIVDTTKWGGREYQMKKTIWAVEFKSSSIFLRWGEPYGRSGV